MRNMSFMLTTEQIRNRQKTVTRRMGWNRLSHGELVQAVENGMGLKKGETMKKLCVIRVVSKTKQRLNEIDSKEVALEGFPGKSPEWFIDMFCKSHKGCTPETIINRIEFEYENANPDTLFTEMPKVADSALSTESVEIRVKIIYELSGFMTALSSVRNLLLQQHEMDFINNSFRAIETYPHVILQLIAVAQYIERGIPSMINKEKE